MKTATRKPKTAAVTPKFSPREGITPYTKQTGPQHYPLNAVAYAAIYAQAERLGWPECFRDDLEYHDAGRLGQIPFEYRPELDGIPFVWTVRSSGTHFVTPPVLEPLGGVFTARPTSTILDWIEFGSGGILTYIARNNPSERVFLWNGKRLVETTARKMLDDLPEIGLKWAKTRQMEVDAYRESILAPYRDQLRAAEQDRQRWGCF